MLKALRIHIVHLLLVVLGILLLLVSNYGLEVGSALLFNLGNIGLAKLLLGHTMRANQDEFLSPSGKPSNFLRQALEWKPNSASAYRGLGRMYAHEGAYEQAIDAFRQATRFSEDPLTYEALGNAYWAIGQQEQAIASWAKVGGALARLHVMLGTDYYGRGMLDQAITELTIALQIGDLTDQDKVRAFQFLGGIYHERGLLDQAIFWQRCAIEIAPDQAQLYDALGLTLVHAGEIDNAIVVLNRAIALDPELPGPHRSLGAAYADKGMLNEAIREYKRALLLAPNDVWAHHGLGLVYWRVGNKHMATTEWQAALVIDPGFEPAKRSLERALHGEN